MDSIVAESCYTVLVRLLPNAAKQGEPQGAIMNRGINLECDCCCTWPNHFPWNTTMHLANKAGTHQITLQCDGCRTASAVKALAVPLLECRAMTTR